MTIHQLTMDLEDEPGRLFSVTDALGRAGISIYTLGVADRDGVSTARMLVSDIRKAREVVLALDVPARATEVLLVEMANTPGSLAVMLEPVFDEYINIRHLEAFSCARGRAMAVVRFSDNKAAEAILNRNGQRTLSLDEAFGLPMDQE